MQVVKFGILGVPQNWSNWTPNRMALYVRKKEWLDTTIILGRIARVKAGVGIATKEGAIRTVVISQWRRGILDKDGLYSSCKPIIDGLKSRLYKVVDKKRTPYTGAGLIFDDAPRFCDWSVEQEKTKDEPQVWIEVRIEEESATTS